MKRPLTVCGIDFLHCMLHGHYTRRFQWLRIIRQCDLGSRPIWTADAERSQMYAQRYPRDKEEAMANII